MYWHWFFLCSRIWWHVSSSKRFWLWNSVLVTSNKPTDLMIMNEWISYHILAWYIFLRMAPCHWMMFIKFPIVLYCYNIADTGHPSLEIRNFSMMKYKFLPYFLEYKKKTHFMLFVFHVGVQRTFFPFPVYRFPKVKKILNSFPGSFHQS